jgi:hypothetical protein
MTAVRLRPFVIFLFSASASSMAIATGAGEKLQFNKDIRPLLSENCFYCHGPDSETREAGLRLDVRAAAIEEGAIVPGDPAKSSLMERILAHDPDDLMPPPDSNRKLTEATLKRWIEEGAAYETHWAFVPLPESPPAAPVSGGSSAGASPIDAFVGAALRAKKLDFQPEASRETLIRRLTFDLTGLPPTPEDVAAFVADPDPNAYEKRVDLLLASKHYGERMTVDWLDISRYADSFGFQVDRERAVWPWRDWVIKAFNENLPFDDFVTWQIAGDLLPGATDEQIIATAFNRLHQQESEGGSVEEEYRVEYVADRVQTFSTAFLGLTMECARCHDHKYDPITHRDYYSLFAFFQNIDEAGLYSFFTPSQPTPALKILDAPAKEKLAAARAEVSRHEAAVARLDQEQTAAFSQWLATGPSPSFEKLAGEIARYDFDALEDGKSPSALPEGEHAVVKGANQLAAGREGQGLLFTGDDAVNLPLGNFHRQDPFTISLWLKTPDVKERAVVLHRSRAWTDAASRGYELLIEEGRAKWSLVHFWPGNAASIRTTTPLPLNEWVQVTVSSDGSGRAGGLKIHFNGAPVPVEVVRDSLTKEITGGGQDHIALGERFRDRGFKGGSMDTLRIFERELTPLEVAALHHPEGLGQPSDTPAWRQYFLATASEAAAQAQTDLRTARAALYALEDQAREIMVMRELSEPKKSYVLTRGEYQQRKEEVTMNTPEVLPPLPPDAPRNRLGLARWLTSPEHPLFARVTVNRFWQSLFGRGLVKTAEDLGSQGERPLHPEVLDWLAVQFRDSGWDVKALMKTMVMSRTYRQHSIAAPEMMADDPENQWLARGPRFRLPAEMIRDNALAASGLLAKEMGGPPVNPYEMEEAFKPVKPPPGQGLYRRSLYTNWRRTSPPPAMIAFDAPRRAVCSAKREPTDSPLQALILLNGTQYVEAARVLGEKLHRESGGNLEMMIDQAFLTCLSRTPDARERAIANRLYTGQLAHYRKVPAEAEALLKTGHAARDITIPAPEAAAAAILAQLLLNHDLSVVKR